MGQEISWRWKEPLGAAEGRSAHISGDVSMAFFLETKRMP